jgi:hypothetical protein
MANPTFATEPAPTLEVETLQMETSPPLESPESGTAAEQAAGDGDTTVTHRFEGFTETEALELQMAEAMAMLERDYTSRLEAAVSLDDTGQIEATDTLHGLPSEVTRSLEELQASTQAVDESAPEVDEDEATALLQPPQGRFGTG